MPPFFDGGPPLPRLTTPHLGPPHHHMLPSPLAACLVLVQGRLLAQAQAQEQAQITISHEESLELVSCQGHGGLES